MKRLALGCIIICAAFFAGVWLKGTYDQAELAETRQIHFQFEATSKFIVFPTILPGGGVGLIWIDRSSGERRLIEAPGHLLFFPSISIDQSRLLLIKRDRQSATREIVRCTISNWHCTSLLKKTEPIYSPADVGGDGVLFASSGLRRAPDGKSRYNAFHLYHLANGADAAKQLTQESFYEIDSLEFVNGEVILSGANKESAYSSAVFKIGFDLNRIEIVDRQSLKVPLMLLKGISMLPSKSEKSEVFAFLNMGSVVEYDLVIERPRSGLVVFKKNGLGYSKPVVLGDDVLVNGLFESEYVVSAYRPNGTVDVLERISRSSSDLEKLAKVILSFE